MARTSRSRLNPIGAICAVLVGILAALLMPRQATPATGDLAFVPRALVGEVGRGTLLFDRGDAEGLAVAPLVATDVRVDVSGPIARAAVRQIFRNPSDDWVEAVYVFPLPETAAVDGLRVRVGERVIEGVVKQREAARRAYEAAKADGRKAGLLESERPNIFTTSVANIGPGEEVAIDIAYQETLRYDAGRFRLRFPLVVGPRYIPGNVHTVDFSAGGWAAPTDRVPDADRVTPPVSHPSAGEANPVRLTVRLDAGFPLAQIDSRFHDAVIDEREDGGVRVTLAEGAVLADRDFELVWTPEVGATPGAGLFGERLAGEDYVLLMVMPPTAALDEAASPAREVIFVIDTSGSMAGTSISQARAALGLAIDRLSPGDRFNVIQFNSVTSSLFPGARPVDKAGRARARRYVRGLAAEGGTEMAPAIRLALAHDAPPGFVRQVVFLTDGAVGNEAELFAIIDNGLADSRLFTIGIGAAPNSYFMREAAAAGRGGFTYIGDVDEVAERMGELFAKLERPVLTDLAVTWPDGVEAETAGATLPDLYAGEPVVLTARLSEARGNALVTGRVGDDPWRLALPLENGAAHPGVAKLWARDAIAGLRAQGQRGAPPETVRSGIVDLALAHRLVTEYTSLVAVDVPVARPAERPVARRDVPLNLPEGWVHEKVFGGEQRPAAPVQRDAAVTAPATRTTALLASADVRVGGPGLALPQSATPAPLHALLGLILVLLGTTLFALGRRRA